MLSWLVILGANVISRLASWLTGWWPNSRAPYMLNRRSSNKATSSVQRKDILNYVIYESS